MEALFGSSDNPDLSSVLTSCEPELQELMKQIDIMINHQREEWEAERSQWDVQLKTAQQEMVTLGSIIKRRDREIELLRKQLEDSQMDRQEMVSTYEQQLQRLREELDKLKRSYHKLQRKTLKDTSGVKDSDFIKNQLTSLEAQNKRLTDELSLAKSQMTSVHRECCSEVQRLQSLCDTSQEELRSNQMELERLRPLEALLGRTETEPQLLPVGSEQNTSVLRTSLDHQRLLHEAATMNQLLQAKDQVIRSLEDRLSAQGCAGVETLRQQLETTASKLQCSRTCEERLRAQVAHLKERLEAVSRHSENSKMELELKSLKAQCGSSVTQIQKLSEELHSATQTHSAEVRGMRKEVSKLTSELHQRDLTIAELSGSSPSQRAEETAAQLETTQKQLEALQTENQHLRSLLHSPKTSDSSLRKTLHISELITSTDKHEQAVPSGALTDQLQPAEDGLQDEVNPSRAASQQSSTGYEVEIRRLCEQLRTLSPSEQLVCEDGRPQSSSSSASSASSSSSSSSRTARPHTSPVPASKSPLPTLQEQISLPPSSLDVGAASPAQFTVGRFLEEESLRCNELQHKLDVHIQGMRESNSRTMSKYLPCAPAPTHTVGQ